MDLDFVANLGVHCKSAYPGILMGYEFKINVQDESNPNLGYANIVKNKNSLVEGVLMGINEIEFLLLDSYEGYPDLYSRSKMEIISPKMNKTYTAWVYTGNSCYVVNRNLLLTGVQKKRINNGFPYLSLKYQNKLLGMMK